ncbi:MAG: IS30 family transposase [Pseudoclavibacter sp.]
MSLQAGRRGGPAGLAAKITRADALLTEGGRLTLLGRSWIETGLRAGKSQREIAGDLGVHPSTVSREIRGRKNARGIDYAMNAQRRAVAAAARPKPAKLDDPELRAVVIDGLNNGHSPQQIEGRLKRDAPERKDWRVSHETIYQALYVQGAGGLRHELEVEQALRSGRTSRKPRSRLPGRGNRPWITDANHISNRPPEADDRAVPGHWEGDLVLGGVGQGALITLIERRSRFTLLGLLPDTHDADTVRDGLISLVSDLPEHLRGSLTWDQGTEMAETAEFMMATDLDVWFCDPHSPWQRPTNENQNGLIRQYFPKGTDFRPVTPERVTEVQNLLNTRPRAVLEFATPAETLNEELVDATTT